MFLDQEEAAERKWLIKKKEEGGKAFIGPPDYVERFNHINEIQSKLEKRRGDFSSVKSSPL